MRFQKLKKKTVEQIPKKKLIRKLVYKKLKNNNSFVSKFSDTCKDQFNYVILILFIVCSLEILIGNRKISKN